MYSSPTTSCARICVYVTCADGTRISDRHPAIRHIHVKTGAQNIVKEIKQYQERWLQHLQRMDTNRIPKQALQYKPKDEGT